MGAQQGTSGNRLLETTNITVSVPFTKSSQNDGKEVPSGLKDLRERRIAKRRQFSYRHVSQRGLNAEIARDGSAF